MKPVEQVHGRMYRADLNIHTPQIDPGMSQQCIAEIVVATSLRAGLEIIALTDWDESEMVYAVIEFARELGMVVFPGFETSAGGCHILAIFDAPTKQNILKSTLAEISNIKRTFENPASVEAAIKILSAIGNNGGLVIPAHCDAQNEPSLFRLSPQVQLEILNHKSVLALDVADPGRSETYLSKKRLLPAKPLIQSSNARQITDIGSRQTHFHMEVPSLAALRSALSEPKNRVRFGGNTTSALCWIFQR
jgi:PHP family Zn ribbon phosphoesterase